ncbi:hypothetical protein QYE76_070958 [Lolium multiflorum]|uniref:CCHC-type domain-containing protein n=1 Tax=Lolium multiflorum TaxID=4521 RepID=A0AAD8SKD6_LOLMU|nr:hypothetical protein QYE76_070958 [Lolium multiflorum]
MLCHTCGGKGHFKRDCPNRKVMFINEDNEYETEDDVDPNAPDDDDYDTDGEDAYPSDARTIVVSRRALNVLPSASTQRYNLFQTKIGPDKACKEFGDVFPEEVPAGLPPLRVVHSTTELCPFEVVYGFKPITPLDLLPLPIHERVNMEASKRADFVKKIHVKTKELIEKKGKSNAARMNKKRKEMLFKPGDMVWVHFRKESNSFNVADLTPYDGEDLGASGSPLKGGDDEDIPTSLLPPSLQAEDEPDRSSSIKRRRASHEEVEEQLDVKMDVKLDKEPDMKISHGVARRSGEESEGEEVQAGPAPVRPAPAGPPGYNTGDRRNRPTRFLVRLSAAP